MADRRQSVITLSFFFLEVLIILFNENQKGHLQVSSDFV